MRRHTWSMVAVLILACVPACTSHSASNTSSTSGGPNDNADGGKNFTLKGSAK
jgi:hypothetical protein